MDLIKATYMNIENPNIELRSRTVNIVVIKKKKNYESKLTYEKYYL